MGLTDDGRLSPCPNRPNCVSSDARGSHGIEPLQIDGDAAAAWQALLALLRSRSDLTIVEQTHDYLHVEARTRWLRFVDDLEFHLRPAAGEIAMRSASRVGYSDLGTNRRRLEEIRRALSTSTS